MSDEQMRIPISPELGLGAWRHPFVLGRRYRVRQDFQALRDRFRAEEVLTFIRDAHSRYDGFCGYFFSQPESSEIRVWDLSDDDALSIWSEYFEAVEV